MNLFLTKSEKHLLNLSNNIKKANKRIDNLEGQLVMAALNNDSHQHFMITYEIRELKEQKAELITLLENI